MQRKTIGRRDANLADILIDGDTVSREHAQISFDGVKFTISDIGSTNGTAIIRKSHKIRVKSYEVTLYDGDIISLGEEQISINQIKSYFNKPIPNRVKNRISPHGKKIRCGGCGSIIEDNRICPFCGNNEYL